MKKLTIKKDKFIRHRKYEQMSYGVMSYSYEYLCGHGVGHDMGIHGCDGCCNSPEFKKLYEKIKEG